MATRGAEVKVTISGDASGAQKAAKDTEQAFGGLGKAASALGLSLGTSVAGGAVAAGAAIGAFAAKGVSDFQNVAIASGKMADATGLSVDNASRWIEVSSDVGIGADTISTAFGKMEKTLGTNKAAFAGLAVAGKDGATDINATYLNVIEHLQGIKDPIERATEASKFFGKGFQATAELTATSADELKRRLAGVSDTKVINEAELAKAREFRAAMDGLGDAVQEAGMQLGQALVPGLTAAAQGLTVFLTGIDLLIHGEQDGATATDGMSAALAKGDANIQAYNRAMAELQAKTDSGRSSSDMFIGSADRLSATMADGADASDQAAAAFKRQSDELQGLLDTQLAAIDSSFGLRDAQRDFAKAVDESNTAASNGKTSQMDLEASYDDQAQAALRAADAAVQVAADQAKLHGQTLSASDSQRILIQSLSDMGNFASGPVKAQLLTMIGQLQTIGASKPNPTVTVTTTQAQAAAADIQRKIDTLDKSRPKPVASFETQVAQASADSIIGKIRDYDRMHASATVDVVDQASGKLDAIQVKLRTLANSGRTLIVGVPHAKGGPVAPGVAYIVGEEGPELFVSNQAGSIIPNGQTARMTASASDGLRLPTRGGGSTVVNHVTIQTGVGDPVAIARELKRVLSTGAFAGVN